MNNVFNSKLYKKLFKLKLKYRYTNHLRLKYNQTKTKQKKLKQKFTNKTNYSLLKNNNKFETFFKKKLDKKLKYYKKLNLIVKTLYIKLSGVKNNYYLNIFFKYKKYKNLYYQSFGLLKIKGKKKRRLPESYKKISATCKIFLIKLFNKLKQKKNLRIKRLIYVFPIKTLPIVYFNLLYSGRFFKKYSWKKRKFFKSVKKKKNKRIVKYIIKRKYYKIYKKKYNKIVNKKKKKVKLYYTKFKTKFNLIDLKLLKQNLFTNYNYILLNYFNKELLLKVKLTNLREISNISNVILNKKVKKLFFFYKKFNRKTLKLLIKKKIILLFRNIYNILSVTRLINKKKKLEKTFKKNKNIKLIFILKAINIIKNSFVFNNINNFYILKYLGFSLIHLFFKKYNPLFNSKVIFLLKKKKLKNPKKKRNKFKNKKKNKFKFIFLDYSSKAHNGCRAKKMRRL